MAAPDPGPRAPAARLVVDLDTRLAARGVVCVGLLLVVGFVLADLVLNFANPDGPTSLRRMFNLGREDSLPATVGVVITVLASAVAWLGYVDRRRIAAADRHAWMAMAFFFAYLALDDGAGLHESIGSLARDAAEGSAGAIGRTLAAFPSYFWQVVFVPILGLMTLFTAYTLLRPPRRSVVLLVVPALLCLAAAVGLDFIEGVDAHARWHPYAWLGRTVDLRGITIPWFREAPYDALLHAGKVVEESLETAAMTLLLAALLLRAPADRETGPPPDRH